MRQTLSFYNGKPFMSIFGGRKLNLLLKNHQYPVMRTQMKRMASINSKAFEDTNNGSKYTSLHMINKISSLPTALPMALPMSFLFLLYSSEDVMAAEKAIKPSLGNLLYSLLIGFTVLGVFAFIFISKQKKAN